MKPFAPTSEGHAFELYNSEGKKITGFLWKTFVPAIIGTSQKEFLDSQKIRHKMNGEDKEKSLLKVNFTYLNEST